jgi:hypothetical protein
MLIQFIDLQKDSLNFRSIFGFLSMTITRPIFHRSNTYEVLKRIFTALVMVSK